MIDLHIHTNASSDGEHAPAEIFTMARQKGIQALAFADHNTMGNVPEGMRLAAENAMEFLPAMELNTFQFGLDLHLLAFGLDPLNPDLRKWLAEIRREKEEQAVKRLERLNDLGFVSTWDDVRRFAGDRIPTGKSFLQAILSRPENGQDPRLAPYVSGDRAFSPYVNFYRDYLRGGKPAAVPLNEIPTFQAIGRIHDLGGIAVLAHPSDTGKDKIEALIRSGLDGLEVYSPYHAPSQEEGFRRMARSHGLLITAGSDFHGQGVKPDVELGGVAENGEQILEALKQALERKK